jgi:hypothetical protein
MDRNPLLLVTAMVLAGAAAPTRAHFTSAAVPHWHGSDTWGLLVVALLVGVAAWLDRRQR